MLEVAVPFATMLLVPVIVEFAAETVDVKLTVPPVLVIGVASDKVFVSAKDEASVQVETPLAFELEHAPYTFVTSVSVEVKVGVVPTTGELA